MSWMVRSPAGARRRALVAAALLGTGLAVARTGSARPAASGALNARVAVIRTPVVARVDHLYATAAAAAALSGEGDACGLSRHVRASPTE